MKFFKQLITMKIQSGDNESVSNKSINIFKTYKLIRTFPKTFQIINYCESMGVEEADNMRKSNQDEKNQKNVQKYQNIMNFGTEPQNRTELYN